MHCLGAGVTSPSGGGSTQTTSTITTTDMTSAGNTQNRGNVMNVVRALGVLVCEGRIQGPPKGYKEGPHCYPPLQSASNDHLCDKYNYLVCSFFFYFILLFFYVFSNIDKKQRKYIFLYIYLCYFVVRALLDTCT